MSVCRALTQHTDPVPPPVTPLCLNTVSVHAASRAARVGVPTADGARGAEVAAREAAAAGAALAALVVNGADGTVHPTARDPFAAPLAAPLADLVLCAARVASETGVDLGAEIPKRVVQRELGARTG